MSEILKIGAIGVGGRGNLACQAHRPENGAAVVACCDCDAKMRPLAQERYGAEVFFTTDLDEFLKRDLDAIMILTPDNFHEAHALAAMPVAKKAVFLEKPMAITIAGCDRILAARQEHQKKLFIGHNMRYMGIIRKMKKLITDGAIGEVRGVWCRHFISYGGDAYFRDWHSEREKSTGMLLQKGAHDIDIIHWLAGSDSKRVSAFGSLSVYNRCQRRQAPNPASRPSFVKSHWPPLAQTGFSPKMDIEDQNTVIMELASGAQAAYLQCHFTPDCCRNYTVIGTAGRLENMGDAPRSPIFLWNQRTDSYNLIGDEVHYSDSANVQGGHGGADRVIIDEFLAYAKGEISQTTATPEAARMAVAAGYQATMSLRQGGQPLPVPALPAAT